MNKRGYNSKSGQNCREIDKDRRNGKRRDNKPTNNKNRGKQGKKDSGSKRINLDNERISKIEKRVEAFNDVSWYARNPELLKAAASFPFASVLGNPVVPDSTNMTVPGILQIAWEPTFGASADTVPYALNQASKSMYSFLVHANSRNYNYEDQDLMILIMAGTQVYTMLASMIRAYGIAKTFSEQSRYTPDMLLDTMGFIGSDVRSNLSNMWFDINEMITRASQVWLPNTMPLLTRWFWLNSNIYCDANSSMAQNYLFVQSRYYIYDETSVSSGGCLRPLFTPDFSTGSSSSRSVAFDPSKISYKWDDWKAAFNAVINALLQSEDRGIIFGDILNAYGADKIYAMGQIPVDFQIAPVYSEEVLTQIENLVCVANIHIDGLCQDPRGLKPVWHKQSAPASIINGRAEVAGQCGPQNPILNFHHASPITPDEIVVATRLSAAGLTLTSGPFYEYAYDANTHKVSGITITNGADNSMMIPTTVGSEIVTKIRMGFMAFSSGDGTFKGSFQTWTYPQVSSSTNTGHTPGPAQDYPSLTSKVLGKYAAFDWAPFTYVLTPNSLLTSSTTVWNAGSAFTSDEIYGDYDNYTSINANVLTKLNNMAMFSLLGMPQM